MSKNIYIICPVRVASESQSSEILRYVLKLETERYEVFYPLRDAPQESETGLEIVQTELEAIRKADEVHIFWDVNSKGSHFDLGMAIALRKPLRLISSFQKDIDGKSYEKVINMIQI